MNWPPKRITTNQTWYRSESTTKQGEPAMLRHTSEASQQKDIELVEKVQTYSSC